MLQNLPSLRSIRLMLLIVFVNGFLSFRSFAQVKPSPPILEKRITVSITESTLKDALDKIGKTASVTIIYSNSKEISSTSVTVNLSDKSLKEVLNSLLAPYPLSYRVIDDKIVISHDANKTSQPGNEIRLKPSKPISGKVTDSKGNGLPGATISIKGGIGLTTSDVSGNFALREVPLNTTLVITFIGYQTQEITITNDTNNLSISLEDDNSKLSEVKVVSTGYQTLPKERATGSFSQPIKEEFDARVAPDVLSKLGGITSGLVFNANTTATKSGQLDINIRGRSTIFANDQPLIIVDNFPYSGDINNINPNDVENISILKDAASASIWGVRAGNGVIVITTKKGRLGQQLKVGFNTNLTVFNKPDLSYNPNHLDASSYINLEQYLFGKGYYDSNLNNTTTFPVISPAVELLAANRAGTLSTSDLNTQLNTLRGLNVNDQLSKYIYQKATNQQYALNISGSSNKATYYFSSGYDEDLPSIKDNTNQRITINSQSTFYPFKNLEINAGLNVVQTTNKIDNTLTQINGHFFPYSLFADANGNPLPISYSYRQSYIQSAPSKGLLDWSYYPLNELGGTDNVTKGLDLRVTTGLKYTFIKGLSGEVKYQYQRSNNQNRNYQSQQTYYARNLINMYSIITAGKVTGYNLPIGGILNLANSNSIANNVRGQLNYNNNWKDHSISVLAGYEFSETTGETNNSILYGYNDNLATFTNINPTTTYSNNPSGSSTINSGLGIAGTLVRIKSSFANAAYTFKNRYTISGSARIDGSNYFGVATNQKSVPLWSTGAKWAIDHENFYKIDWLPNLAIRATYGYNGNLNQSVTGVTTFSYRSNATFTNLNYAVISNTGNPDLRWEKTGIANFALDFGLKNDLITGSLEYYLKKETDLLGFKSFPADAGITTLEGNYSDMEGHGFDISLTSQNLKGRLKWSTSLILSFATDKVIKYDVIPLSNSIVGASNIVYPNLNKPVFGVYGYKWGGLDPATGNPLGFVNGAPSQDYATITTKTALSDLAYAGPARPTYFGGLNNRFSYGGFSLFIQINYKFGYYFMAPALSYSAIGSGGSAFLNVNKNLNNRWQSPGDEKITNVPSMIYPFSSARDLFYQYSEVNIEKADHIRLQDISLSYDFNKSIYHRLPFNNLQLFIYVNNIGILWRANHQGLDPDAVPGNADSSTSPNPRSISVGVKGSF